MCAVVNAFVDHCRAAVAVMNATNALIDSLQSALDSNDVVVSDKLPPQLIMVISFVTAIA